MAAQSILEHRPARVLRMRSLTDRVGLSKSEIYRRVAAGRFPQSVKLGPKSVGWLESDVDAWITSMQDAAK
ncbi:hypothetical protein BOC45_10505 [Burkholderia pseudomallei]|nr:hypothetical protein BOC45_10505 [Burkholderia pseudomallei]